MTMEFIISRATRATAQWVSPPVQRALERFRRDQEMTLSPTDFTQSNEIVLCLTPSTLLPEGYTLDIQDEGHLVICAGDELGAVYALLYISARYLGVSPFWYWNDQQFDPKPLVTVSEAHYTAPAPAVRYRGWSFGTAPLLRTWASDANHGWEMALEALLRCGGNMVAPDPAPAALAADMGLWLAQPAATPLGVPCPQMPTPGFAKNAESLRALWTASVRRHKGYRVVWTLGFYGPGGAPVWADDLACATAQQRGARLGALIAEQYKLIRAADPYAPVCTHLQGESAALFRAGALPLPQDVIPVWPDNGYGKFVSRRVGSSDPRLPTLPDAGSHSNHGVCYHVACDDGQAGNQVTLTPTPAALLQTELCAAFERGANGYWLVNGADLKPHTYSLSLVAALWQNPDTKADAHREAYLRCYYRAPDGWTLSESEREDLSTCLKAWADSTAALGQHPDQHAGEQFTNYATRAFAAAWLTGQVQSSVPAMRWLAGDRPFGEQLTTYRRACVEALPQFETLLSGCEYAARATTRLWRDSVLAQVKVYLMCLRGAVSFCDACALYMKKSYRDCFYLLGQAADAYAAADAALRATEHGHWAGFYQNECRSDCKHTATVLRALMALPRAAGDEADGRAWQQSLCPDAPPSNHLSDAALYALMRQR